MRFDPSVEPQYIEHDGAQMLVEGVPILIDHLALVYTGEGNKGFWTRAGDPGVRADQH